MKQEQKEPDSIINNSGSQLFDDIKLNELIYRETGHRNLIGKVATSQSTAPIPVVKQLISSSKTKNGLTIINRLNAPTPSFFKMLRNIGLVLVAVSGIVLTAPLALPAVLVTVAGYVAVSGSIVAAVSQLTTKPAVHLQSAETEGGPLETNPQQ